MRCMGSGLLNGWSWTKIKNEQRNEVIYFTLGNLSLRRKGVGNIAS